jgi:hypothetical protein
MSTKKAIFMRSIAPSDAKNTPKGARVQKEEVSHKGTKGRHKGTKKKPKSAPIAGNVIADDGSLPYIRAYPDVSVPLPSNSPSTTAS